MKLHSLKPLRVPATFSAFLCALVSLLVLGVSEYGHQALKHGALNMGQHIEAQKRLQNVFTLVVDAETGQRGYLLTGNIEYLEPYEKAVSQINRELNALRPFFVTDMEAFGMLGDIGRTVNAKLAELDITIRLRKQDLIASSEAVIHTNIGKEKMDIIRASLGDLIIHQEQKIAKAKNDLFAIASWVRSGVVLTSFLSIAAFFFFARYYARVAQEKTNQLAYIAGEKTRLDEVVQVRTLELTELARYLQNVREEEKARLARDLHDELGAILTVAKLDAAALKSNLKDQPIELKQKFDNLMSTLNEGISLKRRIIEDLRPSALSNLGFIPALELLVEEYKQRNLVEIECYLDEVNLDEKRGLVLYRLMQESFTNIFKYAEATHVRISLEKRPQEVVFRIQDDGVGFDLDKQRTGHGLSGMRFRLASVQGRLQVSSADGNGTLIEATVPFISIVPTPI